MKEKWAAKPNIPDMSVSCVIASPGSTGIDKVLSGMGIRTVQCSALSGITGSEASHADMSFCHVGGDVFFAACNLPPETKKAIFSESARIIFTEQPVTAEYPFLNVCVAGKAVFANVKRTDPVLLETLRAQGLEVCHVNQRYARCSIAVVSDNAIITADESVIPKAKKLGFDVLKISPGYIELDGYPYGFIGGCCGLLGPDILAFCGSISLHPEGDSMRSFAREHGVDIVSLSDGPLCDIGGILPIKQRDGQ